MRYIDVDWKHNVQDDPIRLVSEIAYDGFETRKLEFFSDGQVGWAAIDHENEGQERSGVHRVVEAFDANAAIENSPAPVATALGLIPVPDLDCINEQPEFSGKTITTDTFEALWTLYVADH